NLLLKRLAAGGKLADKNHQTQGPLLMNPRFQEGFHGFQRSARKLSCQFSKGRHFDSDENVTFTVFAGACLEKPLKTLGGLLTGKCLKTVSYFSQNHGSVRWVVSPAVT